MSHIPSTKSRASPVPQCIEIAEEQLLLQSTFDRRDRARDLAGHESFASNWTLMVEKDAGRGMHAVGLPVVDRDPVRVELGGSIWRARIEGRRLPLRTLPRLAEELRGGSLIEAGLAFPAENANRLEQAKGPKSVGVGRVLRGLERHLHMRLRG